MLINGKNINYIHNNYYIIAELCCNFCGDVSRAKQFIDEAKKSGVQAIKFQKRNNKKIFTKEAYNAKYTSKNAFADTYGEHREKLELSINDLKYLFDYVKSINLDFIITPFDIDSYELIENNISVDAYKISSYDFDNLPLIRKVLNSMKPVILSTGSKNMEDVIRIHNEAISINNNICIMQCTSCYPCDTEYANINIIDTYRKYFPDTTIGFSCHNSDIYPSIGAYCKGALIIEKHFTNDRTLKGTDNVFSLTPKMTKDMIYILDQIKPSFGNNEKKILDIEKKYFIKLGKKLVASKNLKKGHILTEQDIDIKSPADGIEPIYYDDFIGKELTKDIAFEENLSFDLILNNNIIKNKLYLASGVWEKEGWFNHTDSKSLWYKALYNKLKNNNKLNNFKFDFDFDLSTLNNFPIENNKLDIIYTSHLIEHLTDETNKYLFKDCYRMLKKNGIIRITCPNIDILFDNIILNKNKNTYNNPWKFLWN